MFDKLCEAEAVLRDVVFEGTDVTFCGDHKRSNTIKAATASQQKHLEGLLPASKDANEYGDIISMLYRQLSNQFSGRGDAYEFGRGVDAYPEYMAARHPAEYRPRASAVGQHYDMNAESALTTYYTWCYDLEYLLYLSQVKKDGLNKMEIKLVRLLACTEVKMAVKAEALLWIKLFLPLRIALNAEDMDLRCLDMNE